VGFNITGGNLQQGHPILVLFSSTGTVGGLYTLFASLGKKKFEQSYSMKFSNIEIGWGYVKIDKIISKFVIYGL
jgi:hypothetical protein